MSDDGAHALTLIAMLGHPFSPRYARARANGPSDPLAFSVFNVALRSSRASAWACTERPRREVARDGDSIAIGASAMEWSGSTLTAHIDERTAPWGRRIRGRVRVVSESPGHQSTPLDREGKHLWQLVAPRAHAEIELETPHLRFSGAAYVDANAGREPLERGFAKWSWARSVERARTIVSYDVERRDGSRSMIARAFEARGGERELAELVPASLGRTRWGLDETIACDSGSVPTLTRRLEDTPFYARSLVSAELAGERVRCVHESLSLERFERAWVQFLVPFRMRRKA